MKLENPVTSQRDIQFALLSHQHCHILFSLRSHSKQEFRKESSRILAAI